MQRVVLGQPQRRDFISSQSVARSNDLLFEECRTDRVSESPYHGNVQALHGELEGVRFFDRLRSLRVYDRDAQVSLIGGVLRD